MTMDDTEQGAVRTPGRGDAEGTGTPEADAADDLSELVRKGLLAITLIVLLVASLVAFFSIGDAIGTWFRSEWVPVARSVFAVAVVVLSLLVLIRLAR